MVHLIKLWNELRSSYWFVPTLMSILAAIASIGLSHADAALGDAWVAQVSWIYPINADGARGLLTTVAGSMIGVAGVTFSITIATLSYTTSTLGPRLLTNFMNDTGNQVTLGTFVGTFVYCLMLLRTVQDGGDGSAAFVPHLSLLFAMELTVASLAALIYFIHHITESLHVSNVVGNVARDLDAALIDYTERADTARDLPPAYLPPDFSDTAVAVPARSHGYIQNLVYGALVTAAKTHDLTLRLEREPGDFAAEGQTLLWAWPATRIDDDLKAELAGAYALGRQRTQSQDIRFLINELVEIAARALSPGINDPFTAMGCLDWLSAGLIRLAKHDIGHLHRFDDDDRLRLWVPAFNFQTLASAVFDPLRPYFGSDRNAALHMLEVLGGLGDFVRSGDQRKLLREQVDALRECALAALSSTRDKADVEHVHRRALRRLTPPVESRQPAAIS